MAKQIAFAYSKESEKELLEKGFKPTIVYIKDVQGGGNTNQQVTIGDNDFLKMTYPPFQFVTTSYWGAGF